jgi:predicted Rossmann fold flavoprotein
VERTVAFFAELGVELKHEPEFDKLFPVTDDAHTVRDALVGECARLGCAPRLAQRVTAVEPSADGGFVVRTAAGAIRARRVVLATGGRSVPLSGSDGFGYELAKSLGHTVTTTVPALVPLLLEPNPLAGLDGIAFPAEIRVLDGDRVAARVQGPLLVTHFGVSGPAALDVSRHWAVAAAEGRRLELRLSFAPGREAQDVERAWIDEADRNGGRPVVSLLAGFPRRVLERILATAEVRADQRLGELSRVARGRLLAAFTSMPLPVKDTRGFNAAEVTAGGVPVAEIDPRTMESKVRPGLHLVGEILEVEGRLGGFNFQWAWATGFVCGQALAAGAAR